MTTPAIQGALINPEIKKALETDRANNATDLAAMRAAFVALTAKLDADAGVTDTDYAATLNPPALTTM